MDFLPDDLAKIADQLGHLASGPEPGVGDRILGAVRRTQVSPASPPPPRFGGGRDHRSAIALLLTFAMSVPLVTWNITHSQDYRTTLNPQVMSLVGGVDEGLASQISFDAKNQAYVFNQNGKKAPSPAPTDTYSLTLGADKSNPTSTYSVDLPVDPKSGFTYYDNHAQLSVTLIPQFPMGPAQETQGRIVYPMENGGEAIYTVKGNGLREDLIFTQPTTTASFGYQLKLPDTLQAQTKDGVIGIYSADPSLFGNISFGSDADKLKVVDARSKSAKTNLVFAIAPPTVADIHGNTTNQVNYQLSGNTLQVTAQNLSTLTYPITLDPSIVVNSTAGFALGNNEDGNIDFPANQISRGGLTGGVIGSWTATTVLPTATRSQTSVAYNGYVYEIGGYDASLAATAVVDYAPINANGTIGSWTATTSLPVATYNATSVAYNGYLYEIGGYNVGADTAVVDYAPIRADGTLGIWTATTSLLATLFNLTSVAYNGYVYEIGGCSFSCGTPQAPTTGVAYAPIKADGTLGTWALTTSLLNGTNSAGSVAYNGYLYEIGGATTGFGFPTAEVDYAPINANGTIGAWTATTSLPLPTSTATSVAYNGYLYEIGGYDSAPTAAVDYAPINANGTIGAWTATTSLPTATDRATSVAYNGYVYEIGGFTTAATAVVDYAKIQPAGWIGSGNPTAWGTTTATPSGVWQASSVAYNGYVYLIGGCTAGCGGAQMVTTVDYAPINTNGTIGTWTATTPLPAATTKATSVAYNGYLYEIGGGGGLPTAVVDYVAINANGTLASPWNATTSLLATARQATSVAYNGYVYEIGGCTGLCSTSQVTTVEYAPLNANGTVGTWTATTSLPAATGFATSVVYSGYVYEIGGCSASCIASPVTTVDYAPINSNGTLGAWTATSSLPVATDNATSVAYNGYVYEIGGLNTPTAVVDYAPINANGTIGSWTATTSLPAATSSATSVAYNGYVYEIDGCGPTCGVTTVDYAPINNGGPGTAGAWTATTSLPVATYSATSVAYNGYIYEIGGCATSCPTAVVDYAPINASGTLGAWTATTSLPAATYVATSVAYNGYIYEIGGCANAACTSINTTVDYAPTNANGTIGSWTATAALPTALYSGASASYNGFLYEIGGSTDSAGTSSALVYYAPTNANGTVGAWAATTSLSVATQLEGSVAYNGYLYETGGFTLGATAVVDYATINANGTIGAWTATTSLPAATDSATAVAYNGYVYEIGGCTGCPTSFAVVDYAPLNANGSLGPWTATTSLPVATQSAGSVVYNGYVYEIGGFTTVATTVVDYAPLNVIPRTAHYSKLFNEGASGGVSSWNATTSLPVATSYSTSVAYNGFVYDIAPTAVVDYAPIGSDGNVGTWTATSSLPTALNFASSVAYNGYIYELGGQDTIPATVNTVYYAQVNANGTLGAWATTTPLTSPRDLATSVAYNGYLYEIGGCPNITCGISMTLVQYAQINANGTIGAWTTTTSLLAGTDSATSVVYNGYVYEIGGYIAGAATAVVDYAVINTNGTIGAWTATTSLPAATSDATSVAYNGYLYEIGGNNPSATAIVDYAPINAAGTIGSWNGTASLPAASNNHASVVYNGYIYAIGVATSAIVDYAPIIYPIPIGTLVSIQYQGTLPGGAASISFETAGSNGLLTASALAPTVAQVNCISGSIQYIWIRVTLDDSQAGAVFADSIGTNNANLTSFTITYMAHPPANQRLHGGKQFSNNVQGPLDTCHT